jgi:anti-sigma regulatory factor (Ser/Thr protein kinase)
MAVSGRVELRLPPEPESVAEAREKLVEALSPRLDGDRLETVRLLVSELVTNAVRHGGHGAPLEVRASWDVHVRVEVVDWGNGFAPLPRTRDADEPGGYGLYLVGTLAGSWGVESNDHTTVWFEL